MKTVTGKSSTGRARLAAAITLAIFAASSVATPAFAADVGYGYGAPAYPPAVQYEERYESAAPLYPPYVYQDAPVEYRVLVYPPRPRYYDQSYDYAPPPYASYDDGRRYARVVRPQPYPAYAPGPYGPRHYVEEPLLPPAPVGPPRW